MSLRRELVVARTSDFQENGVLRARTLNDELDYQVAALQEVKESVGSALRLDPSETGGATTLPLRRARANKLLGFDSAGAVTVFDRDGGALSLPFQGAVPRTVEDKLAERLSARDFGAVGDGAADDGPALQAAMNAAAASGKRLEIGEGTFRTSMPLVLPGAAAGLSMRGAILYAGPGGRAGADARRRRRGAQRRQALRGAPRRSAPPCPTGRTRTTSASSPATSTPPSWSCGRSRASPSASARWATSAASRTPRSCSAASSTT